MFNNGFYPTPDNVIELMLAPYIGEYTDPKWNDTHKFMRGSRDFQILEPSAGKGDIVDYLYDKYKVSKGNIYCIELDNELQAILQMKGYKVIDSDFLSYNGRYSFDLILMNPPFDNGVKHILKAWQILVNGDIVCLLNAETVNNPYSKERQLLQQIISQHGSVEYIGSAFADAERHTDVDVVIVRLKKVTEDINFETDETGFQSDSFVIDEEFVNNAIAKADMIDALVDQYNKAVEIHLELNRLEKQYKFYLQGVKSFREKTNKNLNSDLEDLKDMFWQYLFNRTKLGQETTSAFQKKIEDFRSSMKNMSFNRHNILMVFDMFMQNRSSIMQQCIEQTFERATAYHKKNKIHYEGWKTNSAWKVNRKIIYPYGVSSDWLGFRLMRYNDDFLNDIDKCCCFLQGKKIGNIRTIVKALEDRFGEVKEGSDYRLPVYSTYFEIRFYRKGTIHLTWLDKDLWQDFNFAANKNQLPGNEFE